MLDKDLEEQYLISADTYAQTLTFNGDNAVFYVGVQFGLDARETELSVLKARIQELEEQINNLNF